MAEKISAVSRYTVMSGASVPYSRCIDIVVIISPLPRSKHRGERGLFTEACVKTEISLTARLV